MKFIFWLLQNRTIPLNILFAGYLVFLQPLLLQRLQATGGYQSFDPLVGGMLIVLQLVELAGVFLKLPVATYLSHHHFNNKLMKNPNLAAAAIGCILFPWIFHLLIAVFLGSLALDVLIPSESTRDLAAVIGIFVIIFKETAFIALNNPVIGTANPTQPVPPNNPLLTARTAPGLFTPPEQITLSLALRDLLGDLLLLLYSAGCYTVLWDANPFFTGSAWGLDLFALIYFVIVYISIRSIYFMQDIFLEGSRAAKLGSLFSFLIVLIVSMLSVPWR